MLLASRVASSSKDVIHLLSKQSRNEMLHPASYSVICKRVESEDLQNTSCRGQSLRLIHVTKVNKDIEAGLRALGSGVAATGVIGSGIGIGIVFGNYVIGVSRNPSVNKLLMTPAILGVSFCEALGLFAIMIAFMIQP